MDDEGIKEKKKQKLMKAGFEARARARREKEREREEREADEKRDEDERERNLKEWASRLRSQQEVRIRPFILTLSPSKFSRSL